MIAFAAALLAMQADVPPSAGAPVDRVIDVPLAAHAFISACWRGLRDPTLFHAAAAAPSLRLRPSTTEGQAERLRSDQIDLLYRQNYCRLTVHLASEAEVDRFLERITATLGLAPVTRGWVADASVMTLGVQWHDVPIADGFYRLRDMIEYPSPIQDPDGPLELQLSLSFLRRPLQ